MSKKHSYFLVVLILSLFLLAAVWFFYEQRLEAMEQEILKQYPQ